MQAKMRFKIGMADHAWSGPLLRHNCRQPASKQPQGAAAVCFSFYGNSKPVCQHWTAHAIWSHDRCGSCYVGILMCREPGPLSRLQALTAPDFSDGIDQDLLGLSVLGADKGCKELQGDSPGVLCRAFGQQRWVCQDLPPESPVPGACCMIPTEWSEHAVILLCSLRCHDTVGGSSDGCMTLASYSRQVIAVCDAAVQPSGVKNLMMDRLDGRVRPEEW